MNTRQVVAALSLFGFLSVQFLSQFSAHGDSQNLAEITENRANSLSSQEIEALNEQEMQRLIGLPTVSGQSSNRAIGLKESDIQKLLTSIDTHPVAGPLISDQYERGSNAIGYCFGRATYLHLLLLSIGVDRRAIQKLWVVGPVHTLDEHFQFHVATAVRSLETNRWRVIDYDIGKVFDADEWYEFFRAASQDQKMSFFATSPTRFGTKVEKYQQGQMGLTMDAEKDWYRGYFKDLMAWFNGSDGIPLGTKISALNLDITRQKLSCQSVLAN